MYIKCWGSRGSIPVSGKEFLKYGGDTTCIEIRARSGDIIIIDAGTGIRRLGNKLSEEKRDKFNFILTHAHWDHLMGFPFFKPLYNSLSEIHMHQCPFPAKFMENMITEVMKPPNFPVRYSELKAKIIYEKGHPDKFDIGSITVIPIPLSHPNMGRGYKFIENGKSFVFITDNEIGYIHQGGVEYEKYLQFSSGATFLIHDAEYTPEEYEMQALWGHSSYMDALNLALEAEVKMLGLFHINPERTDHDMDKIVGICRKHISEKGKSMKCFAVERDMTFIL